MVDGAGEAEPEGGASEVAGTGLGAAAGMVGAGRDGWATLSWPLALTGEADPLPGACCCCCCWIVPEVSALPLLLPLPLLGLREDEASFDLTGPALARLRLRSPAAAPSCRSSSSSLSG